MKRSLAVGIFLVLFFSFFILTHNASAQNNKQSSEEWYLPTDDKAANLYVYEIGRGEPVVVLHGGFGAEHSYMLDAVRGLENKYHFIFFDQRGSLRSPCKIESMSFDKLVDDLETLRKSLGLEKMTLFSHSMATYLAMAYLQKYPNRVKNIVLTGTLPLKSGKYLDASYISAYKKAREAFAEFEKRPEVNAEIEKIRQGKSSLTAKQETEIWRVKFTSVNVFHIERWRQMKGGRVFYNEEVGKTVGASVFRQLTNDYDFTPIINNHPYTIISINGDRDFVDFSNTFFKRFATETKNLNLVIIRNAGHNAWFDDPNAFKIALDKGLRQNRIIKIR